MNAFFWLSRFWRIPSLTDTVERLSSSTPMAMPLTYSTMSGRLPDALALAPCTVTSSAKAKWLACQSLQSTSQTVTVFSPTSGLSFTP